MVDPIIDAVEVWLAFFNNLPQPIISLFNLVLFIMLVFFVVRLVERFGA